MHERSARIAFASAAALSAIWSFPRPLAAQTAAVTPASQIEHCLAQLLIATGLSGDDELDLGGDADAVLVHDRAGGASRYFVFSQEGSYTLEAPWPKASSIQFAVVLPSGTQRYRWQLEDGRAQSQASGKRVTGTADVTADSWSPPDAASWAIVQRILKLKLPMVTAQLAEQRAFDAKKHTHTGVPNGEEDAFRSCQGLGAGEAGSAIATLVDGEYAKWKQLAASPIEYEKFQVVRRADHPEWYACNSVKDCVVADGPCGWPDVIARSARKAYASWSASRDDQINCDQPEPGKVTPACNAGKCSDPAAAIQASWSACKRDDECQVYKPCIDRIAVNKKAIDQAGFQRWNWWQVQDGWETCHGEVFNDPGKAKCVASQCQIAE